MKKSLFAVASAITILTSGPASAQTSMNGPYYANPSWDQQFPAAQRFIVLSNWNNEAVLDRETGLVWQRNPNPNLVVWVIALQTCLQTPIGGRYGWRLPAVEELATLLDPTTLTLFAGAPLTLPANIPESWTSTTSPESTNSAYIVSFAGGGDVVGFTFKDLTSNAWCVRGYQGTQNPRN